jgi:hypothetical protein
MLVQHARVQIEHASGRSAGPASKTIVFHRGAGSRWVSAPPLAYTPDINTAGSPCSTSRLPRVPSRPSASVNSDSIARSRIGSTPSSASVHAPFEGSGRGLASLAPRDLILDRCRKARNPATQPQNLASRDPLPPQLDDNPLDRVLVPYRRQAVGELRPVAIDPKQPATLDPHQYAPGAGGTRSEHAVDVANLCAAQDRQLKTVHRSFLDQATHVRSGATRRNGRRLALEHERLEASPGRRRRGCRIDGHRGRVRHRVDLKSALRWRRSRGPLTSACSQVARRCDRSFSGLPVRGTPDSRQAAEDYREN